MRKAFLWIIEEFPIYQYHVTSAGQSSNWTTSGIKQHILAVDLTFIELLFISVKISFKEIQQKWQLLIEESDKCNNNLAKEGYELPDIQFCAHMRSQISKLMPFT